MCDNVYERWMKTSDRPVPAQDIILPLMICNDAVHDMQGLMHIYKKLIIAGIL